MALIICPECQQQISDQATVCPKCGYPFPPKSASESVASEIAPPLPSEGPAVPEATSTSQKKNKGIIAILAAAICIAVVALTVFLAQKSNAEQARATYIENLNSFLYESLSGAAKAESACSLTYKVWYDTIYEEYRSETVAYTQTNGEFNDDFNTSLAVLYSSDEMLSSISEIESNQDVVDELYKALQNPSEEFEACFNVVEDMYSAYYNLTNLAISPSGSIRTYSDDYSDYDSDFIEYYDKLSLLIPEE